MTLVRLNANSSMTEASIEFRIRDLFLGPQPPSAEDIRALLAQLHTNVSHASGSMHRAALHLLGSWVIFVLLGTGLVERVEVFGLSLKAIDTLLVLGPPMVGAFSYLLLLSYGASNHLIMVVSKFYSYHLPKLYEQDLELYLIPPTFSTMENLLAGRASSHWLNLLHGAWLRTLTGLILAGSLGAVLHTSYFLLLNGGDIVIDSLSVLLGAMLWLRGITALMTAYQASST